jgi:NhaP-type Na+/H+ or K+/H+ antiporter
MSDLMVYTLAAGMGLVLGAILGLPQWLALRRYVPHAGWWVPANALAWMLGMVVIFIGTSLIPASGFSWQIAILLLMFVVAAGAVVGAVHGWCLIWLLHRMNSHSRHEALPSLIQ